MTPSITRKQMAALAVLVSVPLAGGYYKMVNAILDDLADLADAIPSGT